MLKLSSGWQVAVTPSGERTDPRALDGLEWHDATVPGTAAQALTRAKRFDPDHPASLDAQDVWYRVRIPSAIAGETTLGFEGLATLADVWLDGTHLLRSENMYHAHRVPLRDVAAGSALVIRFEALTPWLATKKGRARWRPVFTSSSLRWARTTLLGRAPSYCASVHCVGPWREVWLGTPPPKTDVRVSMDGDTGVVRLQAAVAGTLTVAEHRAALKADGQGGFSGELRIPHVQRWWPHTHGVPTLYPVALEVEKQQALDLGSTGFRTVEADTADGGFALRINGERVFCRGAVWITADLLTLGPGPLGYRHWLTLARDAGMNMIRVPAQTIYEHDDFYRACDELGLMVWHELMFAVLDYPTGDAAFEASVRREAAGFLTRTRLHPSLTVLCGGAEMEQQPAMFGLAPELWTSPLTSQWLPEICSTQQPDLPYVRNSPSGGPMPFVANRGVSHYYGVGAYLRPLDDARRSDVRFATESLGFANLPEQQTVRRATSPDAFVTADWQARAVTDEPAALSFADIRDHYVGLLYGVDVTKLKKEEPERYRRLSIETTGEVMLQAYAEFRRAKSTCAGALVWTFQDPQIADGWGVVDALGSPKPVLDVLRRALQPQAIFLLDEGVNGLSVQVINERPDPLAAKVTLLALRDGRVPVVECHHDFTLEKRSTVELSANELLGWFFDFNRAYRFGPPSHDVTIATLRSAATGEILSQAFHFPEGRASAPQHEVELKVSCTQRLGAWQLVLESDRLVQSVRIDDDRFRASDNGFHLVPGVAKVVQLIPRAGVDTAMPEGEVSAITLAKPIRYRGVAP